MNTNESYMKRRRDEGMTLNLRFFPFIYFMLSENCIKNSHPFQALRTTRREERGSK